MSEITDNFNEPLSPSNCSMNQRDNEQIEKPSLLCLNDNVLLHVFSYLDLSDSINLAETCVRLHDLSCWEFKKYGELDATAYSSVGSLPLQKILYSIGQQVQILKVRLCQINNYDVSACINVKSLRILDCILNDYSALTRINLWITKLDLESVWFVSGNTNIFYELLNGVTNLKELRINHNPIDCRQFVSRNTNVERLSLNVKHNINGIYNFNDTFIFEVFSNLHHLKSLHFNNTKYLNDITRFGNLNGLTEFSCIDETRPDNTFLKYLAENTKLDKLRWKYHGKYDGNYNKEIFTTLKLMNLSALSLCCRDDRDVLANFILEYSAPQLKHLQLSGCSMEHVENIVGNWKNLETICLYLERDDFVKKCLDEAFIKEILKLSTDRPILTLHVNSLFLRFDQRPCHIKVCFKSQTFTKSYGIKACFMSTAFGFSDNDCIRWLQ